SWSPAHRSCPRSGPRRRQDRWTRYENSLTSPHDLQPLPLQHLADEPLAVRRGQGETPDSLERPLQDGHIAFVIVVALRPHDGYGVANRRSTITKTEHPQGPSAQRIPPHITTKHANREARLLVHQLQDVLPLSLHHFRQPEISLQRLFGQYDSKIAV